MHAIIKKHHMDHQDKPQSRPTAVIYSPLTPQGEPQVTVGIVSGRKIVFSLNAPFEVDGRVVSGDEMAEYVGDAIFWRGHSYTELMFSPTSPDASFSLRDVTIGLHFHWERKETQTFLGALRLVCADGQIQAINHLPVERYLQSVISSEMSATSSLELLKAHAVISRSWLLAQIFGRGKTRCQARSAELMQTNQEIVRWYDREDHELFDVCADDHCQRYQGITKATSPHVAQAVEATRGQALTDGASICDARFSKCCGGVVEEFQYCWANTPKGYLKALADSPTPSAFPDLTVEANADAWIRNAPPAYCNTRDARVLSQVLNNYDQKTTDFYRWRVVYTQRQLSDIVDRKLGARLGQIVDLVPLERGKSGRIYKLRIVGTLGSIVIGKELEIRRALSESHLYSSAFVVDKRGSLNGAPVAFELIGAGWGHGVGLCQIGAAMMGERGFSYLQILAHYYPGASVSQLYE